MTLMRICIVLGFVFTLCFNASAQEWKTIDRSESVIRADIPGIVDGDSEFRRKHLGYKKFVEQGRWKGRIRGRHPRAFVHLVHLDPAGREVFTATGLRTFDEMIRGMAGDRPYTLEEAEQGENVLGQFEYRRFSMTSKKGIVPCVFLRQFSGYGGERFAVAQGGTDPLGTTKIEAWYCAHPNGRLTDSTMNLFFTGLGVKGWAVPCGRWNECAPTETR